MKAKLVIALLLICLLAACLPMPVHASGAAKAESRPLTADSYVLNNPLKYTDPSGNFAFLGVGWAEPTDFLWQGGLIGTPAQQR